MERVVGMAQAKSKLSELVARVAYAGDSFILERRGTPMAILLNVDEYKRLQASAQTTPAQRLPEKLYQRQEKVLQYAKELEAKYGDPIEGMAEITDTLPPEGDDFWEEVLTLPLEDVNDDGL